MAASSTIGSRAALRRRGGRHAPVSATARRWAAVMLAPAMLVIVAFVLVPVALTLWISLHQWSMFTPIGQMRWVGAGNYTALAHDASYLAALRTTAAYTALAVGVTVPLALLLGLLLSFPTARGRTVVRTILFSTYVIPTVAIAIIWGALYAPGYGPLDTLGAKLGLPPLNWLSSPDLALVALVIFNVWQMLGYYTVLVVAGITQIPAELYEAAQLDGAGRVRQARSITIPLLRRTLAFVVLVGVINAVQVFDPVYVLTQGGPVEATNVLSFHIQRSAFQYGLAGQASAMAFTLLLVLVLVAGAMLVAGRRRPA